MPRQSAQGQGAGKCCLTLKRDLQVTRLRPDMSPFMGQCSGPWALTAAGHRQCPRPPAFLGQVRVFVIFWALCLAAVRGLFLMFLQQV